MMILLLAPGRRQALAAEQVLCEELDLKVLPALARVEEAVSSIQISGERSNFTRYDDGDKLNRSLQFTFSRDRARELAISSELRDRTQGPGQLDYVIAMNSDYAFRVIETLPGQQGDFRLRSAEKHAAQRRAREASILTEYSSWGFDVGYRIWGVPIRELASSDAFQLVECRETDDGHLRIAFDCVDGEAESDEGYVLTKGRYWAELDPDLMWQARVSGVDFQFEGKDGAYRIETEYRPAQAFGGIPVPSVVTKSRGPALETGGIDKSGKKGGFDTTTLTFEEPKPFSQPDEVFRLPHYGISESVLETKTPRNFVRYAIGIGAIVIAALLIMLVKRSRKTE